VGVALLGASGNAALTTASTTYYGCLGNSAGTNEAAILITTEAQAELVCRNAGKLSALSAYIRSNSWTVATPITIRQNEANTALAVSVTAATSGLFQDLSDSVTLSAADKFCYAIGMGAGSGSFIPSAFYVVFTATSTTSSHYDYFFPTTDTSISTTAYLQFAGNTGTTSTEAPAQVEAVIGGTAHNLYMYVTTNTRVNTSTVNFRIGGVSKTQTLSITTLTTGAIEDLSDSDTLTAGNLFNGAVTTGISAGTLAYTVCGVVVDSATPNSSGVYAAVNGLTITALVYQPILGRLAGNIAAASQAENATGFYGIASGLEVYVASNTDGSNDTCTFFNGGTQGNQSVSITASTTGWFSDSSHNDAFASTGLLYTELSTPGSNSYNVRTIGMLLTFYLPLGWGFGFGENDIIIAQRPRMIPTW
jgi:hypothetical protein